MGYSVIDVLKPKSDGGNLGNHIDRNLEHKQTFKNADSEKRYLNQHHELNKYCKMEYHTAIQKRIEDANVTRKIQHNAVKVVNLLLSGSHEDMIEIEKKGQLKEWIDKSKEFVISEYGVENITRFVVHLDEKTPHIHVAFVPIINTKNKKGDKVIKLSAFDLLGSPSKMAKIHTDYHKQVGCLFGLERGVENSSSKKVSKKEYERLLNQEQNKFNIDIKDLLKNAFLNKGRIEDKVNNIIEELAEEKVTLDVRTKKIELMAQKLNDREKEMNQEIIEKTKVLYLKSAERNKNEIEKRIFENIYNLIPQDNQISKLFQDLEPDVKHLLKIESINYFNDKKVFLKDDLSKSIYSNYYLGRISNCSTFITQFIKDIANKKYYKKTIKNNLK